MNRDLEWFRTKMETSNSLMNMGTKLLRTIKVTSTECLKMVMRHLSPQQEKLLTRIRKETMFAGTKKVSMKCMILRMGLES
jgi:hypothetical protein